MDTTPSVNRLALSATVHCLTGCGIGEVLGLRMSRTISPTIWLAVAIAAVLGGCQLDAAPDRKDMRLSGAIYTDFRVDLPCEDQEAPVELTGVELSFKDASTGRALGATLTGRPERLELPKGPGTETWAHGGCRMYARYQVILPLAERYSVEFTPSSVPRPANRPYFQGVDLLEPQSATIAELADRGFTWDFEAPPAFVVP